MNLALRICYTQNLALVALHSRAIVNSAKFYTTIYCYTKTQIRIIATMFETKLIEYRKLYA